MLFASCDNSYTRKAVAAMDQSTKFDSSRALQLEFHEPRAGTFFWLYRSPDGWIVAEADRTYTDLKACVSDAYQYVLRAFSENVVIQAQYHGDE